MDHLAPRLLPYSAQMMVLSCFVTISPVREYAKWGDLSCLEKSFLAYTIAQLARTALLNFFIGLFENFAGLAKANFLAYLPTCHTSYTIHIIVHGLIPCLWWLTMNSQQSLQITSHSFPRTWMVFVRLRVSFREPIHKTNKHDARMLIETGLAARKLMMFSRLKTCSLVRSI